MDESDGQRVKGNRRTGELPVYKRIEQNLRARIESREWTVGTVLRSRPKLAEHYTVSLATLEQAIALLLNDGTLRAEAGRGTFVAQPSIHVDPYFTHQPSTQLKETFADYQLEPAQSPVTNPLLGLVAGDLPVLYPSNLTNPDWNRAMLSALSRAFSAAGGAVTFLQRHHTMSGAPLISLEEALRELLERDIQALVIANVTDVLKTTDTVFSVEGLERVPTVLLTWADITGPLPQVIYDNTYAGYLAAQHLRQAGYEPQMFLALLSGWWQDQRVEGAQMALRIAQAREAALKVYYQDMLPLHHPDKLVPGADEDNIQAGYEVGGTLFADSSLFPSRPSSGSRVPGFIATNDAVALGMLKAAREMGKRPGIDFGLVGFDDMPRSFEEGLTTLRPPLEEIGTETARLLLGMLRGENVTHQVRLRSQLIVRLSTHRRQQRKS